MKTIPLIMLCLILVGCGNIEMPKEAVRTSMCFEDEDGAWCAFKTYGGDIYYIFNNVIRKDGK